MTPSHGNPRLHLVSGLAFLVAGALFLLLARAEPRSHRLPNLAAGLALLGAALLQVLAYRKRRRT